MTPIDRGFHRMAAGLVHYRIAGRGAAARPLLMIHGGPGSSSGLVPMIAALAGERPVIAPDLMGNGDSDPPPAGQATIAAHADRMVELLDALGVDRFDVYGHHSGAQVACELAIARPDRVGRLILNGLGLFPAADRAEFAARYAPPIVPVDDGAHLAWVWTFARNLTRFFPHYRDDDEHRVGPGTPLPPDALTRIVADVVKVWPTYHLLYAAAFAHDLRTRLPLVTAPTLVLEVDGDPLADYAVEAADLLSESRVATVSRADCAGAIASFLTDRSTP